MRVGGKRQKRVAEWNTRKWRKCDKNLEWDRRQGKVVKLRTGRQGGGMQRGGKETIRERGGKETRSHTDCSINSPRTRKAIKTTKMRRMKRGENCIMLCAITLALLRMIKVVRMVRLSLEAPTMPKRSTSTIHMRRAVKGEKIRVAERRSKQ